MPEMTLKWTNKSKKNCVCSEAASKMKKLRLDCAGASGSRLGHSRKYEKTLEKTIYEPAHLQTRFYSKKY